jgi:hypothetical protein
MKRRHVLHVMIASAIVAAGCAIHPPRFVVADPASLAARNDDHWLIRALPAPDAGAPDASPPR